MVSFFDVTNRLFYERFQPIIQVQEFSSVDLKHWFKVIWRAWHLIWKIQIYSGVLIWMLSVVCLSNYCMKIWKNQIFFVHNYLIDPKELQIIIIFLLIFKNSIFFLSITLVLYCTYQACMANVRLSCELFRLENDISKLRENLWRQTSGHSLLYKQCAISQLLVSVHI